MPLVSSVDYPNKRIYLSVETMNADLDTIDVYKEVRALRRTTETHQKFKPMIIAGGNIPKIPGVSATPSYVQLLYGCRIIPYGTGDHKIKLVRDTFTDDGFAGRDCFDRSSLTNTVDIDVDFPEIEIRYLASGGSGLSTEEHNKLMSVPTAPANALANWQQILENGMSAEEMMRIYLAVLAGKVNGAGTGVEYFRSNADDKDRVISVVDTNGNRTAVIVDGT